MISLGQTESTYDMQVAVRWSDGRRKWFPGLYCGDVLHRVDGTSSVNVDADRSVNPPLNYALEILLLSAGFKPDRALFGKNMEAPPSRKFSDINV